MPGIERVILGIDPGLSNTGFGVIRQRGQDTWLLEHGVITTSAKSSFADRLGTITQAIDNLFTRHAPALVAIEELFFAKNVSSALKVGQAKGAVITAANLRHIPVQEFTPLQIKLAITGYGKADKKQVQKMVKLTLRLPDIPRPDHAADALAVALCCAHTIKYT